MSFMQPSTPPPFVPPAVPQPAPQLAPASQKPPRRAMQPSFIGAAMAPQAQARSLIGGAPTTTGTTGGFGPGSSTYSG
jgi:hypothetical protein